MCLGGMSFSMLMCAKIIYYIIKLHHPSSRTETSNCKPLLKTCSVYTCKHFNTHRYTDCWQCSIQIQRHTNKHSKKLLGRQKPEWPIFSCLSLMSAIKSARHQYFSVLVRHAAIFPFDEARQRCFVLPGRQSSHMPVWETKRFSQGQWKRGRLVDCDHFQ